jgi:hypothetical protein
VERFAHQLALKVGCWNVGFMLRSLTWKQFQDWRMFAELEPFDSRRADYHAATIVATLLNQWRGKNKKPYTANYVLKHLLPFGDNADIGDDTPQQNEKHMMATAKLLCNMFNSFERQKEREEAKKQRRAVLAKAKQAAREKRQREKLERQQAARRPKRG